MLGVSGLRGIIGASLDPVVAARYASALGQWFVAASGRDHPQVVLGRDSRPSGPFVAAAVSAGLVAAGCRVTDLGIATTPAVAVMAAHHQADGGVVITASHNPIQWNGIKALGRGEGNRFAAPPPDAAAAIIERFKADRYAFVPVEALQPIQRDDASVAVHVQRVLRIVDVDRIRAAGLTAVVDSVHGAGGPEAAALLDALGVRREHLYAEPTGRFPHPPEPVREHLGELAAAVSRCRAAIGFAQDPDADRLAIVDDAGTFIGEEYTLALSALHVLGSRAATGDGRPAWAVANLSTSRMIDDIAARCGARVVRTPVGEANVAAAMQRCGALIGGEGNGGVIDPRVVLVRDSIVGMALVLDLLAARRRPLSALVAELPRYAIVKDKLDASGRDIARLLQTVSDTVSAERLDTQDGVRLDWPDRWVHVRPSNTEPIIRIIAEARDEATARALIDQVRRAIG